MVLIPDGHAKMQVFLAYLATVSDLVILQFSVRTAGQHTMIISWRLLTAAGPSCRPGNPGLVRKSQGTPAISCIRADRFASGFAQFNSVHDALFAELPIDLSVMIHVQHVVSRVSDASSDENKRLLHRNLAGARSLIKDRFTCDPIVWC